MPSGGQPCNKPNTLVASQHIPMHVILLPTATFDFKINKIINKKGEKNIESVYITETTTIFTKCLSKVGD